MTLSEAIDHVRTNIIAHPDWQLGKEDLEALEMVVDAAEELMVSQE